MNEMEIRNKFLRGNRLKINLAWLLTIAIVGCTIIFSFSYFGDSSSSNSKTQRDGWVYDNDGLLSDSTINEINTENNTLYYSTGAEIVVAIEKDSSKNKNLPKRAEDLFEQYKVSDSGVLLIVAVPDAANSSGIGAAINEVIDSVTSSLGIETELYAYSYCLGRNVDYSLGDMIEQKFETDFYEYYDKGNYNRAVLSMFGDIYAGYFGGNIANASNNTTYIVNDDSYYSETRVGTGFISTIAVIILVLFMVMVFGKRRRTYTPFRVYRRSSWFGLGLGMGSGMNRRHHHHHHKPHNHSGFGGSFFNGNSGGNRTGGRTGGGFRSGGSSSGRSGGSFRSGGSSSGRSGGGFRGGGSRGGGGRRR